MEVAHCTKIVISRIQKFEPENAMKLIGYLLLKHTDQEIMEFAFGPDDQFISLINEAKAYLTSLQKSSISSPIQPLLDQQLHYMSSSPTISRSFSSPSSFRIPAPLWDPPLSSGQVALTQNLEFSPSSYADQNGGLHNQAELLGLEDQLHRIHSLGPDYSNNYCFPEAALAGGLDPRTNMRFHSGWLESPPKACHYYYKGYCKNGINCRFLHGRSIPDGFTNIHNPNLDEFSNEDCVFAPGQLSNLESEITELLKSKRGMPVSIASLPTMYLEKYGKTLQADGYLTESQRHGKAGFSLTKLLNRLNNSVRLIDRPHGQHSVVLAEDAPKYVEYSSERIDQGLTIASSHQIYLTFPAESTFTEEDVFNYFNQYGPVHDVRIPRQEKRMFGFVSFLYPETVKIILAKGHPHYICGARILVKPYKEKSKLTDNCQFLNDEMNVEPLLQACKTFCCHDIRIQRILANSSRKSAEKMGPPVYFPAQYFAMDRNPDTMFGLCESNGHLPRQLSEDHDLAVELERRRLFELQLNPKQPTPQSYFSYGMEELKVPEDDFNVHSTVPKSGYRSGCIARQTSSNYNDKNCDHIELPDSPFASPRLGSSISTLI